MGRRSKAAGRAIFINREILDINGSRKMCISYKHIKHTVQDAVNGGEVEVPYIRATIQGRKSKRRWVEFYPLEEFRKRNPELEIR